MENICSNLTDNNKYELNKINNRNLIYYNLLIIIVIIRNLYIAYEKLI